VRTGVLGGGKPDTAREERPRPFMELAARLLMQGSGVTTAPASRTDRLRSYKALRVWCRGTLDTAGRFDDPQSEVAYARSLLSAPSPGPTPVPAVVPMVVSTGALLAGADWRSTPLRKLCTGHDADELQVLEHESGG
jgi:hypothetical protein